MRIAQISTSDRAHGAGISAHRLHSGLLELEQDSSMFTGRKVSDDPTVKEIGDGKTAAASSAAKWLETTLNSHGPQGFYSRRTRELVAALRRFRPDVVHFHNIHLDVDNFSVRLLRRLSGKGPLFWTLHDMWPLTGHCIFSGECERYRIGCGSCPDLGSFVPLRIDTTALAFRLKRRIYMSSSFVAIAPSRWMQAVAQSSPLFEGIRVEHIPYGLDLGTYRPTAKREARERLGLDPVKPVVLFIAGHLEDKRKGYQYFEQAMLELREQIEGLTVVTAGGGRVRRMLRTALPAFQMGYIRDENRSALIYSAADVMVLPSLADNLPNTALESIACGTPVVAFATGGIPEIIDDQITGYLVAPKDTKGLAGGVARVLRAATGRAEMSGACVERASRDFSQQLAAQRHLALYADIRAEEHR